jgi:hypothetical protein
MPCAIDSYVDSSSIVGRHELVDCGKNCCKLPSNTTKVTVYLNPVIKRARVNRKALVLIPENITPKK